MTIIRGSHLRDERSWRVSSSRLSCRRNGRLGLFRKFRRNNALKSHFYKISAMTKIQNCLPVMWTVKIMKWQPSESNWNTWKNRSSFLLTNFLNHDIKKDLNWIISPFQWNYCCVDDHLQGTLKKYGVKSQKLYLSQNTFVNAEMEFNTFDLALTGYLS